MVLSSMINKLMIMITIIISQYKYLGAKQYAFTDIKGAYSL